MKLVKCLLIGILMVTANFAIAQATKALHNVPPAPDSVSTPGARLVMGESPDVDFTILDANEEAQTRAAPTPLPHNDTAIVQPVAQPQAAPAPVQAKPSVMKKIRKQLAAAEAIPAPVVKPAPVVQSITLAKNHTRLRKIHPAAIQAAKAAKLKAQLAQAKPAAVTKTVHKHLTAAPARDKTHHKTVVAADKKPVKDKAKLALTKNATAAKKQTRHQIVASASNPKHKPAVKKVVASKHDHNLKHQVASKKTPAPVKLASTETAE